MKTRLYPFVLAGVLLAGPGAALAFKAPAVAPLPNLDKRQILRPDAVREAAEQQALAKLQKSIRNVQIARDAHLGLPKAITASRGFLTSADARISDGKTGAREIIKSFLDREADFFGHDSAILRGARLTRDDTTEHSGLRTVIWEQVIDGVPVFEGLLAANLARGGELIRVSSRMLPDAAAAAQKAVSRAGTPGKPAILAPEAIILAAAHLGAAIDPSSFIQLKAETGAEKQQSYRSAQLRGEVHARLVWLPVSRDELRLCWRVLVSTRNHAELYMVVVDAQSGEVMIRRSLTNYLTSFTYNVYTSDSPSPFSPGWSVPSREQPPEVERTLVSLIALSTNASPAGWIFDGDSETRGNNVDAHTDRNDDDAADLPRPNAGATLTFDFPLDLTRPPATYTNASVVQLFYLNNWMHDKLYDLGFTESAGNFQDLNFDRGGYEGDAVQADAQDGGGTDNANFTTWPDGYPGRMQMYVFSGPNPNRDGDLDAEVVLHEYTHGLSNRLVGGGVGIYQLQPAGMGEGWSDFYALSLLSEPDDDPDAAYATGGYVTYQLGGLEENYYFGIRRYPYSTDLNKNPLTLKDIDPTQASAHAGIPLSPIMAGGPADEVHAMGEVWCVALWDARALLVKKLGGDEGNKMILRLVTDGMKLSPENPTFLEARDAIIQADESYTGGDNRAELWTAFAKRGMGPAARVPDADNTIGVVEDFNVPDDVVRTAPDGVLEIRVIPPNRSALLAGRNENLFVRVTDSDPVTNAVVTATIDGKPGPVFKNDGTAPDQAPNNSVYSAFYKPPSTTNSVTITLVITAPDKDRATNIVTYSVVAEPVNDMFKDAIKIPALGASYLNNNKLASREDGEPQHGFGSLWWIWSSSAATNVLIDTSGSPVDTELGVYTGTQVDALTQVAVVNDVGSRRQAYYNLEAKAGIAYRIAVASPRTNDLGTLKLRVTPGGKPDLTAPVITVTSPPSGISVSTNRVNVSGNVVDPSPNASGVDRVLLRVSPTRLGEPSEYVVSRGAGGSLTGGNIWFEKVALSPGRNVITATAVDIAGNQSTPIQVEVNYLLRDPVNDFFVNASRLTGDRGTVNGSNAKATLELDEPIHAGNRGGGSVWWTWKAPADGLLTLTTTNSNFDTLLAVYQGLRVNSLSRVVENDDASPNSGYSRVEFAVKAGESYHTAVDGFDGQRGTIFLRFEFVPGEVFTVTTTVNGSGRVAPPTALVTAGGTVQLEAQPDAGFDFLGWSGGVASSDNPLTLTVTANLTLTASFGVHQHTDGFETGNLSALPWITDGDADWTVQGAEVASGNYAAASGVIDDFETSNLRLTVNSAGGVGSFDFRLSSEPEWDFLEFMLNGSRLHRWSGEVPWTTYQFPLPEGSVTLEWRYVKDASRVGGLDGAFLDNLDLPLTPNTLLLADQGAAGFQVQFQRLSTRQVVIEESTNLRDWKPVATLTPVNGVARYTGNNLTGSTVRFYRAVSQ